MLERYFKLAENHTSIRPELVAGLTTFMTMAYIIVVNPQILSQAGLPAEGVVFATCISSAAATLVMGLYANYPIAMAPGMSLNAYFTYAVCLGMNIPWRTALGVGVGFARGIAHWPSALVSMPHPGGTFLKLDLRGALHLGLVEILFAFLFVDLFDNVGTLVGVCEQAGFVKDGRIPRVGRVLVADGVGTILGSLTGTSTVTSYIESAAGIAAGARTGLSNLVVAALFLLAVFFAPVAVAIPGFATSPALILVGALMTQTVARVAWGDFSEAFPAFLTMLAMPLTFSIATGLSLGVIAYSTVKIAAGKYREVSPVLWILTILFAVRYLYLAAA